MLSRALFVASLALESIVAGCGGDPATIESPTRPLPPPDASPAGFAPPWGGQVNQIPAGAIELEPDPNAPPAPVTPSEMTFFVTSTGNGDAGGDFGGVSGADAVCQKLAEAAGSSGKTWVAYLSTKAENARARIGSGPWKNARGGVVASDAAALHQNGIPAARVLDESGQPIDLENAHDILTGSKPDGTFAGESCRDYTSRSPSDTAWVGHADGGGVGQGRAESWNAAHETHGCDPASLQKTASRAHLYCFAK